MRPFLATVSLGLALVAGLNLYADPSRRLLRRAAPVRAAWGPGESLLGPLNFDDRRFRAEHIKLIPRPDLLVLGSSRALEVRSGLFARGLSVYNAWMTVPTVEDYAAVWQALKEADKVPARILILCDSWVFNANSPYVRWRSNARLYESYRAERAPGPLARPLAALRTARDLARLEASEWAELVSLELLTSSWRELRAGTAGSGPAGFETRSGTAPLPDRMAWRSDGSGIYSERQLNPGALTRTVAVEGSVHGLDGYAFSPDKARELEGLLADMRARGARVFVLIPPYQSVVLEELEGRPSMRAALPDHRKALAEMAARGGFALCDALEPARSGCSEDEFLDGMHMRASCVKKTLDRCLGADPAWAGVLSHP